MLLRDYEDAIRYIGSTIDRSPTFPFAHVAMAVLYSELDRTDDAAREVATTLELVPQYTSEILAGVVPYGTPDMRERFLAGLRKAGFPDGG